MNEFFHVSSTDISVGSTFNLMSIDDFKETLSADGYYTPGEFQERLRIDYPHGITKHGQTYLFSRYPLHKNENGAEFVVYTPMIETTFEMVRQGYYSSEPSRFTSVFGVGTIDEAHTLISTRFGGKGTIFRVSCDRFWKKDMNLVIGSGNFAGNMILARKYWEGKSSSNPFWEILMAPPVKVIEKVS